MKRQPCRHLPYPVSRHGARHTPGYSSHGATRHMAGHAECQTLCQPAAPTAHSATSAVCSAFNHAAPAPPPADSIAQSTRPAAFTSASSRHAQGGFTLIEIIVTIILAAIMSTMLLTMTGTALRGSAESLVRSDAQSRLTDAIESMTADYRNLWATEENPIGIISGRIGAAGSTVSTTYGTYTVVVNRRIRFVNTGTNAFAEQADANGDMLRVTIEVNGQQATTLFSR
ncbi:conserved hypothetical protein [Nitratidesulfovibrio vulgaris DP4]|uniref:Prepilin-type N-terminal cleavage/methylation domain-containing protein n=1 Tax=Nitratidesulfovibrio vulgaris (strain DP4) TaxID=391774 RepID=A0A0H3A886_NITV4|nr:conserved hypothetical protein [Nitratidesulfovibrio vulgaris DP4]